MLKISLLYLACLRRENLFTLNSLEVSRCLFFPHYCIFVFNNLFEPVHSSDKPRWLLANVGKTVFCCAFTFLWDTICCRMIIMASSSLRVTSIATLTLKQNFILWSVFGVLNEIFVIFYWIFMVYGILQRWIELLLTCLTNNWNGTTWCYRLRY